jgi:hypothetical protein
MDPVQNATSAARDALYVAVGFGLLGFNKAQVRRRELTAQLESLGHGAAGVVEGTPLEGPLRLLGVRPRTDKP